MGIKAAIGSWNLGAAKGVAAAAELDAWLNLAEAPDLVAVALQEAVDINSPFSYLGVPPNVTKLLSDAPRLDGLDEWLSAEALAWQMALSEKLPKHTLVAKKQQIGNVLFVFATKALAPQCAARVAAIGTGPLGAGNKGAVAASLVLQGSTLCILCAHLAAGNKGPSPRNKEFATISANLSFALATDPNSPRTTGAAAVTPEVVDAHDVVIWAGDLNYRIALPDLEVHSLLSQQKLAGLAEKDELTVARSSGAAFGGFEEGPLNFRPTYKYDPDSDLYDTSSKKRAPAWTDRILWKAGTNCTALSYGRHELRHSDHRPVSLALELSVTPGEVVVLAQPQPSFLAKCFGPLLRLLRRCFFGSEPGYKHLV